MINKPITVARMEYMQQIVELSNSSPLPAFVKVGVLEQALAEMRKIADNELKRDLTQYREAERAAKESTGGAKDDKHDV